VRKLLLVESDANAQITFRWTKEKNMNKHG